MGYVVHWKDGSSSEMDDTTFENIPAEMEGEIGRVEQAATPDGFTDKVTSSPMSAAELEQFYKENPDLREELLKYAPGLPSVQSMPNREEGTGPGVLDVVKQIPGNVYQGVRDILAKDVGGPLGSLISAWDTHEQDPVTGLAVPRYDGAGYWERVGLDQPGEIERGQRGEGLPGLLSDPMNLTIAVPGIGEGRIASLLGKVPGVGGRLAATALEHPSIATGLGNALVGGATAGGSAVIDPLQQQSSASDVARASFTPLQQAGIGAATGGLLGGLGRYMKGSAIENYPGAQKLENMMMGGTKNTQMVDLSVPERIRALDLATARSTFPTRKDFFKAANEVKAGAQADFERGGTVFKKYEESGYPYGYIHTDDLGKVMEDRIMQEAAPGGSLSTAVNEDDIQNYLAPIVKSNALTAKMGRAPLPMELKNVPAQRANYERLEALRPGTTAKFDAKVAKMADVDKHLPVSELGRTLGTLNQTIGGLMSKKPAAEAKMAMAAHQGIVEDVLSSNSKNVAPLPITGYNPEGRTNKELADYLRAKYTPTDGSPLPENLERELYALENLRTPLAELPGDQFAKKAAFNDFLEKTTRPDFGFAAKMLEGIKAQADIGTSMRWGMPQEWLPHFYQKVGSNYGAQGMKYKVGKMLERPGIGAALTSGLITVNDLWNAAREQQ